MVSLNSQYLKLRVHAERQISFFPLLPFGSGKWFLTHPWSLFDKQGVHVRQAHWAKVYYITKVSARRQKSVLTLALAVTLIRGSLNPDPNPNTSRNPNPREYPTQRNQPFS